MKSRWVPYEFGRAKSHSIVSSQAAGWFERPPPPPPPPPETWGDYLLLAEIWRDEPDVVSWLMRVTNAQPTSPLPAGYCATHSTAILQ
jgi:hypothetical protein